MPAERPSSVKPQPPAISATLAVAGSASRSAIRTAFSRRRSTYRLGLMLKNSAQQDRKVRSVTPINLHSSGKCNDRPRWSAKISVSDFGDGMKS